MVRRSTPAHVTDERYFPVRVRIAVPAGGFGNQLDRMYGWLNLHAGRGNYAIHSAPNDLGPALGGDAAFFYFVDVRFAAAFLERFSCGLAIAQKRGTGDP